MNEVRLVIEELNLWGKTPNYDTVFKINECSPEDNEIYYYQYFLNLRQWDQNSKAGKSLKDWLIMVIPLDVLNRNVTFREHYRSIFRTRETVKYAIRNIPAKPSMEETTRAAPVGKWSP